MVKFFIQNKRGIVCLLVFMVILPFSKGQEKLYSFAHLEAKNDVFSHVNKIYQDSKGLIWIGTLGGLTRYDGNNYVTFKMDETDSTAVCNNVIYEIYETKDGVLLIGTEHGLSVYNYETENFKSFIIHADTATIEFRNYIRAIKEDANGNIWFGTFGGGIVKFKPGFHETSKIKIHPAAEVKKNIRVNDILLYKNRLYVATEDGLVIVNPDKNEVEKHYNARTNPGINGLNALVLTDIQVLSENELLIGTWRFGANIYNINTGIFTQPYNSPEIKFSLNSEIIRETLVRDNEIWLATFGQGIKIIDRKTGKIQLLESKAIDNTSINNNFIWTFYEDNAGVIWVGTYGGSVNRYDSNKHIFNPITVDKEEFNIEETIYFSAVYEDSKKNLWLGTVNNGVFKYDINNNKLIPVKFDKYYPGIETIRCIYEDKRGNYWFGTHFGVVVFNSTLTEAKYINDHSLKSYVGHSVQSIAEDKYGNIWTSTWGSGVNIINKNSIDGPVSQFEVIKYKNDPSDPNSLANNIIWKIKNINDVMYVGTQSGLERYNDEKGIFEHIQLSYKNEEEQEIPMNYISTILEYDKENFLLGPYQRGLAIFNSKNDSITYKEIYYQDKPVLFTPLYSSDKFIWGVGDIGLIKVNRENFEVERFNNIHGLDVYSTYLSSFNVISTGEMVIGSDDKFYIFDPLKIKKNTFEPQTLITDVKLNGESVINLSDVEYIKEDAIYKRVNVPPSYNALRIDFSAIYYSNREDIAYRYKLHKFDKQWYTSKGDEHEAIYTNLDKGLYTFEVYSQNPDKVWSTTPAIVEINVIPPFYKTWFFRIVSILIIMGIIMFIYYQRINAVKRRNLLLEETVKERTKEINKQNKRLQQQATELSEVNTQLEERQQRVEEQAEELRVQRDELHEVNGVKDKLFSIVAHDLKNPFNILMGYSDLLDVKYDTYNDKKRKMMIGILKESSHSIFELLQNLLNWSRSQRGKIEFQPNLLDITEIIDKNINLITNQAAAKNIKVEKQIETDDTKIYADFDLINTVIRNLSSNAVKFTEPGGTVTIRCIRDEYNVTISVEDTGVGIPLETQQILFRKDSHITTYGTKNEKGTGLGLIMCADFVTMHKGKIWVESEEGKGSKFKFNLPIHSKTT